MTHAAIEVTYK